MTKNGRSHSMSITRGRVATIIIAVGVSAVLTSGCACSRAGFVKSGTLSIESVDSQRTKVYQVDARQEGDDLIVTGRLRRRGTYAVAGGGHVDITVIGPDGKVIDEGSTWYTPSRITKGHSATFTKRFTATLPEGSVIRVVHNPHGRSHQS